MLVTIEKRPFEGGRVGYHLKADVSGNLVTFEVTETAIFAERTLRFGLWEKVVEYMQERYQASKVALGQITYKDVNEMIERAKDAQDV